jgi:ribosome biogenesis protein MAK21
VPTLALLAPAKPTSMVAQLRAGPPAPRERGKKNRTERRAARGEPVALPGTFSGSARLALHMLSGELVSDADVAGDRWYECAPTWPVVPAAPTVDAGTRGKYESAPAPAGPAVSASAEEWTEVAGHALNAVSRAFEKKVGGSEEARKKTLAKETTVGDKIAAVTLMVQESPVHRLEELRMLLGFAQKKGRRERGPAIDALKDLFVNDLLPDDRRLIPLTDRDFASLPRLTALSKRHLAYAMFESDLKAIFREFLAVIDECSKDAVIHFKQKASRVCFDLLIAKPENEKALLSMLVNDLGSPERKVASSAGFYLNLLVTKHHPVMKLVVVREVELLVHRPNIGLRTRYYSVSFLNQIRFVSGHDVDLARRLVRIYMDLFAESVSVDRQGIKQKGSGGIATKESRLMGALLTGVNRAFPFSKPEEDDTNYGKQFESLFQVAHAQSLTSATQALSFLFQVAQSNSVVSDRFYRALYCRIPDAASAGETKQALFLNLLFKALKADISAKRVKAFAKRLLQAALQASPGFAAGALLVLSEVMVVRRRGLLKSFVLLSEGGDADEEFGDADDGGIVVSAVEGAVAECGNDDTFAASPGSNPNAVTNTDTVIVSADKEICGEAADVDPKRVKTFAQSIANNIVWGTGYEPAKRDPLFAKAEESCLWEINALCSHYHPSVVSFAKKMREAMEAIKYEGDPLKDFTFGSFLDKFSYRKPKKHVVDSLHGRRSARLVEKPLVNTAEFLALAETGLVDEDDKFFLRFFQTNPERTRRAEPLGVEGDNATPEIAADGDAGSLVDSEEEAFEEAMRVEMIRLGAGGGPASGAPGDIDEVDEDELRAFKDAFGEDGIGASDEDADIADDEEADLPDGIPIMRMLVSDDEDETGSSADDKPGEADTLFGSEDDAAEAAASAAMFDGMDFGDGSDTDSEADSDDSGEQEKAVMAHIPTKSRSLKTKDDEKRRKKPQNRKSIGFSAFAPVEDYAEALDAEVIDSGDEDGNAGMSNEAAAALVEPGVELSAMGKARKRASANSRGVSRHKKRQRQ